MSTSTMNITDYNLRSETLFQIIKDSLHFEEGIELYVYSLSLKKSWNTLEKFRKSLTLNPASTNKLIEWERLARRKHMGAKTDALKIAKMIAHELSDKVFEDLKTWIHVSDCSKIAYKKRVLSIDDGLGIIEARLMQIIYMYRIGRPVDLNQILVQAQQAEESDHI